MPPSKRRRLFLVLALAGTLTCAGAGAALLYRHATAPPAPPDAPEMLEPAVLANVRAARAAVLAAPRSAEAWGELTETFLANQLDDEASACAAVAERLDPGDPRWPYFRAGVLLNRGDREAAAVLLRRAARLDAPAGRGGDAPALLLVEVLLGLGRLDEAEVELRGVQERLPDEVRVRFDRGLLAVARQDDLAARDLLRGCLDSPFTRQKARTQLAPVCQRLGDPDAERFRREARLVPEDARWEDPFVTAYLARSVKRNSRFELAEQLQAQGRFLEAARAIEPMTQADPTDDVAWLEMGKALAQGGRARPAEFCLRRALELAPGKAQPYHYLALFLWGQGEAARADDKAAARRSFEESVRMEQKALAIKPDYGLAHLILGVSLRGLRRNPEAIVALRQAVLCNPEHGEIHFRLGEALAEGGHIEEARQRLGRALRLAPPGAGWVPEAKALLARLGRGPRENDPQGKGP